MHCFSVINNESLKYLTTGEGSLIVFLRATSLDFDSDAIVTAGFGLEKINTIIHHFNK